VKLINIRLKGDKGNGFIQKADSSHMIMLPFDPDDPIDDISNYEFVSVEMTEDEYKALPEFDGF